jgi:hypothetical protein
MAKRKRTNNGQEKKDKQWSREKGQTIRCLVRNKIKHRKKYKIRKSLTPLGKISVVLWLSKPHQRTIQILSSGVFIIFQFFYGFLHLFLFNCKTIYRNNNFTKVTKLCWYIKIYRNIEITVRFKGILKSTSFPNSQIYGWYQIEVLFRERSDVLVPCHMIDVGQVCTLPALHIISNECKTSKFPA